MRSSAVNVIFVFLLLSSIAQAQNSARSFPADQARLDSLSSALEQRFQTGMESARDLARERGMPLYREMENGEVMQLQGLNALGNLVYYTTQNLDAARTTGADQVWPGGGLGYSLNGDSIVIAEWDGGGVRTTHQELTGRVTVMDGAAANNDHATHVAGTLIGSGVVASAKGMAYTADVEAYDFYNDEAEMAAAASGQLLSNHSYVSITGWFDNSGQSEWWGDTTISGTEDYLFGFYNATARTWDQIAESAPYYLICKAAGNDRQESYSNPHYLVQHGVWSSTSRAADGGTSGYDCISTMGTSKNVMTVGAVNAIPGGYTAPSDVVMSSFSCWGPTDDGRIKPDLVANGVGVYSSLATNNSAYASWNGTSMATPNAAGSMALVQEHYHNLNGQYMLAATLKALMIHTAHEAGTAEGPDYRFGWGLLNAAGAVVHITDSNGTDLIEQATLNDGQNYDLVVKSDGTTPLMATICWSDIPGTSPAASLDPTTPMLVNDLDLRIVDNSGSTVYLPYVLDGLNPANAATKADNSVDNVEKVYIASPAAGTYTIRISHKNSLDNGNAQNFSLITSGGERVPDSINCSLTISSYPYTEDFEAFTLCSTAPGDTCPLLPASGWVNSTNDSIDWVTHSGSTSTDSTGPDRDQDPGGVTGKYLYLEASGVGAPQQEAILLSPCFNLNGLTAPSLSFSYHFYGEDMGNLSVDVIQDSTWSTLWFRSGEVDDQWHTVKVDLSAYTGDTVQLRFKGVTGSGEHSDLAIDGISVSTNDFACSQAITSFPYREDFESQSQCSTTPGEACNLTVQDGWLNDTGDDIDWIVNSGATLSPNTGPDSLDYNPGTSGGKYLYLESSTNGTGYPSMEAILYGPCLDFRTRHNMQITFAYHMYGVDVGNLYLEVDSGAGWNSVWSLSGNQTNQWHTTSVDLSAYDSTYIYLRFRGISGSTGNGWSSDISIDDVFVEEVDDAPFESAQTGDWSDSSSWVGGIPPHTKEHNVLIKSGHVISLSSSELARSVTIENGATLSLVGQRLTVGGDYENNGTFNGTGQLLFQGTDLQTIGGSSTTFNSIEIDNIKDVEIANGDHAFTGTLTLTTGNLHTNDSLTLISDISGTGRIDEVTGGSITGDLTVQRYIAAGSTDWRFLSSAVNNVTLADWNDDFITSGFTGSDYPTFAFTSIYTYNESTLGTYTNGYEAATNITNPINVGEGYWVWCGDSAGGTAPFTIDVTGPANTGTVNLPVTYTDDPGQPADQDGWNMVGNPYVSTIDWDAVGWTKTGVNDATYIWDPDNQQYATYASGIGTNGGSNLIASSQAFWIQTFAAPTLTATEGIKSATDQTFIRKKRPDETIRVHLSGGGFTDETAIRFNDQATSSFDGPLDGRKVYSANLRAPSLSTIYHGVEYAINSIRTPVNDVSIPLKVDVKSTGTFDLKISSDLYQSELSCIRFEDRKLGISFHLSGDTTYTTSISDTLSYLRFWIHLGAPLEYSFVAPACSYDTNGYISIKGQGVGPWDYTWTDGLGQVIRTTKGLSTADSLPGLSGGIYTVQIDHSGECGTVAKQMVLHTADTVIAAFESHPNTVNLSQNAPIKFTNRSSNGLHYAWSFGDGTVSQDQHPAHLYLTEGEFDVQLRTTGEKDCMDSTIQRIQVVSGVTSINGDHLESLWSLYPNPAKNEFSMTFGVGITQGQLELINTLGQVVFNRELRSVAAGHRMTITAGHIEPGLYMVRITDSDTQYTLPLMIE